MCIWSFIFTFATLCVSIACYKLLKDLRDNLIRINKHQNVIKHPTNEEFMIQFERMNSIEKNIHMILNIIEYEKQVPKKKTPPTKKQ